MKNSLTVNLSKSQRFTVDEARTISFLGEDTRVYATPFLLYDIEDVSRNLIGEHLEDNEDTVGTYVAVSHMAATPLGMWVDINVTVKEINGRKVDLEFECNDSMDTVAKGTHSRFIVDKNRTAEQIKAKKQNASG